MLDVAHPCSSGSASGRDKSRDGGSGKENVRLAGNILRSRRLVRSGQRVAMEWRLHLDNKRESGTVDRLADVSARGLHGKDIRHAERRRARPWISFVALLLYDV